MTAPRFLRNVSSGVRVCPAAQPEFTERQCVVVRLWPFILSATTMSSRKNTGSRLGLGVVPLRKPASGVRKHRMQEILNRTKLWLTEQRPNIPLSHFGTMYNDVWYCFGCGDNHCAICTHFEDVLKETTKLLQRRYLQPAPTDAYVTVAANELGIHIAQTIPYLELKNKLIGKGMQLFSKFVYTDNGFSRIADDVTFLFGFYVMSSVPMVINELKDLQFITADVVQDGSRFALRGKGADSEKWFPYIPSEEMCSELVKIFNIVAPTFGERPIDPHAAGCATVSEQMPQDAHCPSGEGGSGAGERMDDGNNETDEQEDEMEVQTPNAHSASDTANANKQNRKRQRDILITPDGPPQKQQLSGPKNHVTGANSNRDTADVQMETQATPEVSMRAASGGNGRVLQARRAQGTCPLPEGGNQGAIPKPKKRAVLTTISSPGRPDTQTVDTSGKRKHSLGGEDGVSLTQGTHSVAVQDGAEPAGKRHTPGGGHATDPRHEAHDTSLQETQGVHVLTFQAVEETPGKGKHAPSGEHANAIQDAAEPSGEKTHKPGGRHAATLPHEVHGASLQVAAGMAGGEAHTPGDEHAVAPTQGAHVPTTPGGEPAVALAASSHEAWNSASHVGGPTVFQPQDADSGDNNDATVSGDNDGQPEDPLSCDNEGGRVVLDGMPELHWLLEEPNTERDSVERMRSVHEIRRDTGNVTPRAWEAIGKASNIAITRGVRSTMLVGFTEFLTRGCTEDVSGNLALVLTYDLQVATVLGFAPFCLTEWLKAEITDDKNIVEILTTVQAKIFDVACSLVKDEGQSLASVA